MKHKSLLINLTLIASMLAACGGASEPQVVEKEVTKVVKETVVETVVETVMIEGTPQTVEQQVTKVVEVEKVVTATPEPEQGPAVGGKMILATGTEVDTLDAHKSGSIWTICQYFGASLITQDPWTGEYLPYLAESWEVAEDGMEYVFHLREDVKFHDGTPLTAHDYAWSFNRAKDPATQSVTAGASLTGLAIVEALDDYTLRFRMAWPNSVLMNTLTDPCYHQPLSQAYVQEMGDDYGRHPIGVGPFKFVEWVTGEKVVLERNPDFSWGPEFTRGGPPYIETIEFRVIPEYATQLAGLEAGEIDWVSLETKDLDHLQSSGQYQIFEGESKGSGTHIVMNTTRPPFDDLRVRRALNHAVNREPLIQVVALGHAAPLYGPLTPATIGYWPGVEYIGYNYDLETARALLAEAGYTPGGDGWLEKDGQPLILDLKVGSTWQDDVKAAQILMEQLKELGIQVELVQLEPNILYDTLAAYDFDMSIETLGWPDFGIIFAMLHSSMLGMYNRAGIDDLDELIGAMTASANWDLALEAAEELQRIVVEQAYYVPLYAASYYSALNNRVQGAVFSQVTGQLDLFDAYIETTTQ